MKIYEFFLLGRGRGRGRGVLRYECHPWFSSSNWKILELHACSAPRYAWEACIAPKWVSSGDAVTWVEGIFMLVYVEWGSGVVGLFMWVNSKRWGSWKLRVCHGVRQQTKWHKCGCLASPFEEKWVAFMAPQFPLDVLLDASSKTRPFPSKLWWVPLHQFPLHPLPPKSVKMRRKIIHYSSGLLETCVFNGSSPSSTIKLYGTPPSTPTVKPPLLLLIFLTSHASAFSLWPTSFWHQSILSPSLCLHPIPCALLGHILEEECTYINTYTSLPTPIYMSMA